MAYVLRDLGGKEKLPQNVERTTQFDSIAIGELDLVEKEPLMIPSCRAAFVRTDWLQQRSPLHSFVSLVGAVLNPQTISLGAFQYDPFPLQAEVSMKVGWFLPI
jgi:hypothetical protein